MANIKLQNNNWEASGIYDIDQQKTQRQINAEVSDLKSALKSGDEEDAIYHLGFYLDENGDLCQVEEETNNG